MLIDYKGVQGWHLWENGINYCTDKTGYLIGSFDFADDKVYLYTNFNRTNLAKNIEIEICDFSDYSKFNKYYFMEDGRAASGVVEIKEKNTIMIQILILCNMVGL